MAEHEQSHPKAPPVYVETLHAVLRATDRESGNELERALVGTFEIGDDFALDALIDELQSWAAGEELEPYSVETRRTIANVGATGIGTEIGIWLLGAGGALALQEVWLALKARLPRGDKAVRRELDWLKKLEVGERTRYLAGALADALGARAAELKLVRTAEAAGEIEAVFETSTGEVYRVVATPDYYVIDRVGPGETER